MTKSSIAASAAVLTFSLLLWPRGESLAAETLKLKAGEHGGFSRVLFPIKPKKGWAFGQENRTVTVILKGVSEDFDLSAVYPRRAAHRIRHVESHREAGGIRFRFTLSCNCRARFYELDEERLILDVASSFEDRDPKPLFRTDEREDEIPDGGENQVITFGASELVPPLPPKAKSLTVSESPDQAASEEAVEKVRRRLYEQLRLAADKGIVNFRKEEPSELGREDPREDALALAQPLPADLPEHAANPGAGLSGARRDQGVLEAPSGSVTRHTRLEMEQLWYCWPDEDLDIQAWRGDDLQTLELGSRRAEIIGEFDRPAVAALLELVRYYLAFGMAVEARNLIEEFSLLDYEGAGLHLDLANVMDGREIAPDGPLLGAQDCGGRHAVLQAYASQVRGDSEGAMEASLRGGDALMTLPRELRSKIALELAQAAYALNKTDEARRLTSIASRSAWAENPEVAYMQGLLDLTTRHEGESIARLTDLANSTGIAADKAALALARHQLSLGRDFHPDLHLAIDGIAMESRYQPEGRQALILSAQAMSAAGRPLTAVQRLLEEKRADPEAAPDFDRALQGLLQEAVRDDSSALSLSMLLTVVPNLENNETNLALRRKAARRLIAADLPEAAAKIIQPDFTVEGRRLLVEALVAAGRQDEDLESLLGQFEGASRDQLLDAAANAKRDHRAVPLDPDLEVDPVKRADAAWHRADWALARQIYEEIARETPDQALRTLAEIRLAGASFMLGDPDLARDTALELLEKGGDSASVAAALAADRVPDDENLVVRAERQLEHIRALQMAFKELMEDG